MNDGVEKLSVGEEFSRALAIIARRREGLPHISGSDGSIRDEEGNIFLVYYHIASGLFRCQCRHFDAHGDCEHHLAYMIVTHRMSMPCPACGVTLVKNIDGSYVCFTCNGQWDDMFAVATAAGEVRNVG